MEQCAETVDNFHMDSFLAMCFFYSVDGVRDKIRYFHRSNIIGAIL